MLHQASKPASGGRCSSSRSNASGSGIINLHYGVFRLAFGALPLPNFECDFFRLIALNDSRVTERINCIFDADVVWVEQAFSDRQHADMKSFCCCFLALIRFQWFIARMAFHDGTLPGITSLSIKFDEAGRCVGKSSFKFASGHLRLSFNRIAVRFDSPWPHLGQSLPLAPSLVGHSKSCRQAGHCILRFRFNSTPSTALACEPRNPP